MKKITLLLSIFFAVVTTNAQNYYITFVAIGTLTTLDSIKTENLTQGTSLTIPGGDILHLIGSDGINDYTSNEGIIKVSPNPMQGQAEISFYAKEAGNTHVLIYDISGRKVLQTDGNLSQGIHKYHLSGLKQGQYFLKICGENYFYTSKLISQNITQGELKIEYIGNAQKEIVISVLKSTKETINMAYTTGDNLRFTGYSGIYSSIVLDVPTISKTITFTFNNFICGISVITDIDSNTYNTVLIGNQCWMKENLKTTHYKNHLTIQNITDNTQWGDASNGAYCCYNNNCEAYNDTYGKLYNAYAVFTGYLCPTGWHVPANAEWTTLTDYLLNNGYGYYDNGTGIAKSMAATYGWTTYSIAGTVGNDQITNNRSGFTGLPAGERGCGEEFGGIGYYTSWWSTTWENGVWYRGLSYKGSNVLNSKSYSTHGSSVRCLKDN